MEKTVGYIFKYSRRAVYCTVLICLVSSVNLFAQTDTTKKLNQVTVNSSTQPKQQGIVPSQSVSANDFIRYGAFNVADIMRDFAGVIIKDYGGIGGLKTISVRGLGANHTAVLYDGVQINDAENGQVDLGKLNLNNIQQITLYNGQPPNILQTARAFASASILAIETVKPILTIQKPYLITAGIKTGSFGLINPYLQLQQRLNNNWSFILNSYTENANGSYKYHDKDNGVDTVGTRINTAIIAQQIDGALYWTKSDSNKFDLHINYYNSNRELPEAIIINTPALFGQRLWNQDLFVQAGYQYIWKTGFHLLLNSKFSHNYLHYYDSHFQSASHILDQHFTQREYYQSAALSYHILPNWEISYAADISLNNMDADLTNFGYPTRITLLNVLASNLVSGNVTLQANLLNSNVTESIRTGNTVPARNIFTPTFMAALKPFKDKNIQLRAFYKSIFRNPTFDDLYYGFVPNTKLLPEFTHQYDVGISYVKSLNGLFDYISFTTDAYYNNVTNKIVFIPTLYNGSTQNFGKVDIKGIDAGLKTQAKLGDGYKASLVLNYSYQRALNVTGPVTAPEYLNQLPYIPENTIALNTGISKGGIGVYYNQTFFSSRYADNNNEAEDYMPPYLVGNASVVYKTGFNHFPITLSAEVDNLFNKDYSVITSYPMPGRSYRFSLQITI